MQVKADLHVHSVYSKDSVISPQDLVFYARKRGLDAVAVVDHDCVDGALKIAKEVDLLIVPGIEISSLNGHIVGLNVREAVPRDLSADETVDRIHDLGGVAIACHPFALLKGSIGKHVTDRFDAVEAINASSFPFASSTRKASELADRLNLPKVAGTDAHYGPVVGWAYTIVEAESTVDSMVKAVVEGRCQPVGDAISWAMRFENQGRFLRKYLKKRD